MVFHCKGILQKWYIFGFLSLNSIVIKSIASMYIHILVLSYICKIVTVEFIHIVELVSRRLCASSSLNILPNSSQNIDKNLFSQEQSKMIILIIAIDRDFKILTGSEQYCGMNFASLTSRKIEYLFTYLWSVGFFLLIFTS